MNAQDKQCGRPHLLPSLAPRLHFTELECLRTRPKVAQELYLNIVPMSI